MKQKQDGSQHSSFASFENLVPPTPGDSYIRLITIVSCQSSPAIGSGHDGSSWVTAPIVALVDPVTCGAE